jgi:chemotaxis protein methyltransferase CheR
LIPPVHPAWLGPLSQLVHDRIGWAIPESQWSNLERNFLAATKSFGYADPIKCFQWLSTAKLTPENLQKLAESLTIGETYFFRERNHFEPMTRHIFEELIQRKRQIGHKQLRIWSAACSSGEEPYSLAILLHSLLPDIDEWSIRILATDITPSFLARAKEAVYRPWSFRGTPEWVKQRYFDVQNDNYTLVQEIKKRVTFDFLNLAEDIYPSIHTQTQAMDLVFCRNVLIYFSDEQARKVIGRLQRSLVKGGWLVLSPTETMYVDDPALHREYIKDAILYRKGEKADHAKVFTPPPPPIKRPVFHQPVNLTTPAFSTPIPSTTIKKPPISAPPKVHHKYESIAEEAERLFTRGLHHETVQLIQSKLDGHAAHGRDAFLLARAYANLGDLDEALLCIQNAVETDKLRAEYHYLLAMIQLEKNASDEAERSLKRVIYLDEQHLMALFSLGHLAMQQQRANVAEKYFQHALRVISSANEFGAIPEGDGMTNDRFKEIILNALSDLKH